MVVVVRLIPTFSSCGVCRESRRRGLHKIVLDTHPAVSVDMAVTRKQHTYYGSLADMPERKKIRGNTRQAADLQQSEEKWPGASFAGGMFREYRSTNSAYTCSTYW